MDDPIRKLQAMVAALAAELAKLRAEATNRLIRIPLSQPGAIAFVARVTGNTQDGSNKRWAYDVTEVEQTADGYGHWSDLSGGRAVTARNLIEDQNGATGTFGNGVASTNLTGTFAIKPVPTGTRIQVTQRTLTDGTVVYWFAYENGVDGAC